VEPAVVEKTKTLDSISLAVERGSQPELVQEAWSKLRRSKPEKRLLGRIFAHAGASLAEPASASNVGWLSCSEARFGDRCAVRGGSAFLAGSFPVIEDSAAREDVAVEGIVTALAEMSQGWSTENIRSEAGGCLATWVASVADSSLAESSPQEVLASGLGEVLPQTITQLRTEVAACLASSPYSLDSGLTRRWLSVALSFHWVMQLVHYGALRDFYGLCLPPLLQLMEGCADEFVRLVGLHALLMLMDKAMAVEVSNLAPAVEDCLLRLSPTSWSTSYIPQVASIPYCRIWVLLLLKGFPAKAGKRQQTAMRAFLDTLEKQFAPSSVARRLGLAHGLLPLINRSARLLGQSLQGVVELLLHSTESLQAAEVLLGWMGLQSLFSQQLFSARLCRYTPDMVLRAALTYITFIISGGPEQLSVQQGCTAVSPVAAAMTAVEWKMTVEKRPALVKILQAVLVLLDRHSHTLFKFHMQELRKLTETSNELKCGFEQAPQVQKFIDFAQSALSC